MILVYNYKWKAEIKYADFVFYYRETLFTHLTIILEHWKLLHQHLFLIRQITLLHFIIFNIYEELMKIWKDWMLNTHFIPLSIISNEDIKVIYSFSSYFWSIDMFISHLSYKNWSIFIFHHFFQYHSGKWQLQQIKCSGFFILSSTWYLFAVIFWITSIEWKRHLNSYSSIRQNV